MTSTATTHVRLPSDPTGHHLASVVHEIGRGLTPGATVVVDGGAVENVSSGLAIALGRLRRRARVLGVDWQQLP